MATGEMLEVEFPVMRYDITVPLIEGRVAVDGVKLKPVKTSSMIPKEDPKLKAVEQALKKEQIERAQQGKDPVGVVRNPERNLIIEFDVINERIGLRGNQRQRVA